MKSTNNKKDENQLGHGLVSLVVTLKMYIPYISVVIIMVCEL